MKKEADVTGDLNNIKVANKVTKNSPQNNLETDSQIKFENTNYC